MKTTACTQCGKRTTPDSIHTCSPQVLRDETDDRLRKEFEFWFEHVFMDGMDGPGEFDAERNCYVAHPVHMAWKGYQAISAVLDGVTAERDALMADVASLRARLEDDK
jgi:hypothetical protein